MKRKLTVILADGNFPKAGGQAWELLTQADRIIACDRAGDRVKALGFDNVTTVGDGDSGHVDVKVEEQQTNDLEKAYRYAKRNPISGQEEIVILGGTGKREDHTIGNIFRALEWGVGMVSDYGRFLPLVPGSEGNAIATEKGAGVSVFAPDPATRMTSEGLEWPLDEVRFTNLYCATLNRAQGSQIRVETDRKAMIYVADAE